MNSFLIFTNLQTKMEIYNGNMILALNNIWSHSHGPQFDVLLFALMCVHKVSFHQGLLNLASYTLNFVSH